MQIVIIADSIDTQKAGIHVYTKKMINALEKNENISVTGIRLKDKPDFGFAHQQVVPPVIPFLVKDPFRLFITLPLAIRRLKPDIVIEPAHFGPFNLPRKIKRVTVIHDLTPVKFPQWHNFVSRNLQRIFLPSILKKASLVITNSNNTSNDVTQIYPYTKGKVSRIYPAVNPFFIKNEGEVELVKQPFFLSVGTLEPRKNLSLLLNAYRLFREKTDMTHKLVICGEKGWKNKQFDILLQNHRYKDDIEIRGYVSNEELKHLYSATTAFIYPSFYEGFGFPVAEAMGCGAPCIVSNRASLPEVGGEAVLYIDPDNPNDLSEKMIGVASSPNLQQELANNGLLRATRFSEEFFVTELEKLLRGLK